VRKTACKSNAISDRDIQITSTVAALYTVGNTTLRIIRKFKQRLWMWDPTFRTSLLLPSSRQS